jgi:hypothetical protein
MKRNKQKRKIEEKERAEMRCNKAERGDKETRDGTKGGRSARQGRAGQGRSAVGIGRWALAGTTRRGQTRQALPGREGAPKPDRERAFCAVRALAF